MSAQVPSHKVSRNPNLKAVEPKDVRVAVIRSDGTSTYCSCDGWYKIHGRRKVRENAAQRHLDKKHGGQGLWL